MRMHMQDIIWAYNIKKQYAHPYYKANDKSLYDAISGDMEFSSFDEVEFFNPETKKFVKEKTPLEISKYAQRVSKGIKAKYGNDVLVLRSEHLADLFGHNTKLKGLLKSQLGTDSKEVEQIQNMILDEFSYSVATGKEL